MDFNLKSWIRVLALVLLVGFAACTDDEPCDNLDCGPNSVGCEEGVCICETGWFGANCEQFDCSIYGDEGCVNGTCNEITGECECDEGWYGADCSSSNPVDGTDTCEDIDCGPNAVDCVDGVCICADGFFGADCSSTDPCTDVVCGDNEVAVALDDVTCDCECAPGFGGENCDELLDAPFIGNYSVASTCDPTSFTSMIVEQTENGNVVPGKVKITNFSNLFDPDGGNSFDVVADILDGQTLDILFSSGNPGYTIIGTGSFTDNTYTTLVVSFTVTDNATLASQDCTDTYTRQ